MGKSDKELTVEIVCAYIHAWGTQSNCVPPKRAELPGLIEEVYNTVSTLGNKPDGTNLKSLEQLAMEIPETLENE